MDAAGCQHIDVDKVVADAKENVETMRSGSDDRDYQAEKDMLSNWNRHI